MKDLNLINDFIKLAKEHEVSELKYENGDVKLEVSFEKTIIGTQAIAPMAATQVSAPSNGETRAVPSDDKSIVEISSPFVGTFYSSPSPDKPAYVKVGDKVQSGQTLCILEAMKIMNEIESDASGEIVEICVENESLVEYGQTLFKIRK